MAALGKGAGRGQSARQGSQPSRPGPGARFGNKGAPQQRRPQQQQQQARAPGEQRAETRRCYNCGEAGHIGKYCKLPDRRKTAQQSAGPRGPRTTGSARALLAAGDDGFAPIVQGARSRLCCLQPRKMESQNAFASLAIGEDTLAAIDLGQKEIDYLSMNPDVTIHDLRNIQMQTASMPHTTIVPGTLR